MSNLNQAPEAGESAVNSAQQSIAQSTALAMADATDNLRNLNTLSTTAIGVALSQFLETGDSKYVEAISTAQSIVSQGAENFSVVGEKIATVLHETAE
ncbi:hypothetical protein AAEU28_12800 [Pseudoalteromonas sp. SS15]|mgnify:CR=1 FL=1|jgi:hypothetical protein|uniref:Uncharacterized protein n=1 Tax=Pseudoalteromonas phenolica TaxID=161398 RepID=A0A0S2K0W1_9GAMM|nr:hypothetical protein [Pseudoalteromonas phenolica]ALO41667.1 hypothetical protein PP2015_1151 [Pseudoalteromonas phenolica]MBE0353783.1 hypothetical protein [Pseudoalteromonas phenolica O-BC30]RXE99044.1 hypothetical protein D9981_10105 [Pseudoalteromonas phenolica O-BC30]TLX47452.1 hypothetical protein C1E24_08875 [Pseudoalteromonas phenolica]TMO57220.1 hypothetical protein CWC21_04890 [Pseudoalteromonas phenolica]|tara:strand:- start:604 stop:897 length:294 start_codon:yes stop_codon:yes gene_type:complete